MCSLFFFTVLFYTIWLHEENVSHLKNDQKDRGTVSVYAGCHKKYHRLGDFNNRNLYSHDSRCYKFKIKMPAYWVMVKAFHDQGRECLKLSVGPYQRSEELRHWDAHIHGY